MTDPLLDLFRENALTCAPKIVTAAHPASAAAGASAYARGGNAFDAALAACFMDTITLPMKCGLAGDLVALVRRGGGAFEALVSVGAGCAALAQGGILARVGPASVGVPGAPHGYTLLHRDARLPLDALIQPAVAAAETGVAWNRVALSYLIEAQDLLAQYSPAHPYAPDGRLPRLGELRRLPGLGALLRSFARDGDRLFEGEIGAAIVDTLESRGGLLRMQDFAQRPGHLMDPVSGQIAEDTRLHATPFPTHGPRLLSAAEAVLAGLPALDAVRDVRAQARREGREHRDGGTTLVTAADDEGNVVVVLHSNSFPQFASGIVMPDGLILNNRPGRGFDLDAPPEAANAPAAGRVPWTTVHAWAMERGGDLLVGGTPGGVNQMPWNVQMVCELARGATPEAAVTNPRWALDAKDVLSAEPDALDASVAADKPVGPLALRSCQQIVKLAAPGGLHQAAVDPRTGCAAAGMF